MNAMMPTAPVRPNTAEGFVRAVIDIAASPAEFKQRLDAMEAARKQLHAETETSIVAAQKADSAQAEANLAWRKAQEKLHELAERTDAAKAELDRLKARAAEDALKREAALNARQSVLEADQTALAKARAELERDRKDLAVHSAEVIAHSQDLDVREAKVTTREVALATAKTEHAVKVKSFSDALSSAAR